MTIATDTTASAPDDPVPPPSGRPGRLGRMLARVAAVLLVVVVLGWLALRWLQPHPYAGLVMQAPTAAPSMDGLVDSEGAPVDLAAYRGDLVLVYFGYTNCPDVCPTTLSQAARARRALGDDADRVHVMMVTVDPDRDRPAMLGEYVRSFDDDFIGVTGDLAAIERAATSYGVFFAADDEPGDGEDYDMNHTASLLGIDTDGRLRIVWPSTLDTDALAADLRELL